jgi:hypothetical protein
MDCFGCNWQCQYNPEKDEPAPCIEQVTVESVINVVKPIIDSTIARNNTNSWT